MKKSTGIFVPAASGFIKLTDHIENQSANGIVEHLGYKITQMYTYASLKNSKIYQIAFEIFSNNIIFIQTKNTAKEITNEMLKNYLKDLDLEYEYKCFADIMLKAGIEEKSFTIEFLSKVLNIEDPKPDGKYFIEKLGYYLYFCKGYLTHFESAEGLNSCAMEEKAEMNKSGYVYALINQSLKGMVKIGKTRKMPDDRAKELSSSTGVPTPFFVAYKIFVYDCDQAEKYVHNLLSSKGIRVSKNREFFHIPLDEIIKIMVKAETIFHTTSVDSENEYF